MIRESVIPYLYTRVRALVARHVGLYGPSAGNAVVVGLRRPVNAVGLSGPAAQDGAWVLVSGVTLGDLLFFTRLQNGKSQSRLET